MANESGIVWDSRKWISEHGVLTEITTVKLKKMKQLKRERAALRDAVIRLLDGYINLGELNPKMYWGLYTPSVIKRAKALVQYHD